MSDSTKSPYELRADLLGMAIGILEAQMHRKFESQHMLPEADRTPVDSFTVSEVLEVAEKLKGFVSNG